MRKEFSNIDWEDTLKECKDNVNDKWQILKTVLNVLEDKYVPQKEVSNITDWEIKKKTYRVADARTRFKEPARPLRRCLKS